MANLIKRYANRKLYNTATSRYITLKGIAELLEEGEQVRVIDNETGDDITSVALSQILVDNERSNSDVSEGLLSQILSRGGDALYGALRKGVDDATENFDEFQDRVRRMVKPDGEAQEGRKLSDWIAYASPDFDHAVQNAVERVFKVLDLPRRSDVDQLNLNLERVVSAIEALEKSLAQRESRPPAAADED